MHVLLLSAVLLSCAFCAKLPEGIKLCHKSDPNLQECLKDGITDGLKRFGRGSKSFGLVPIDPLKVTEMTSNTAGITQVFKNVEITGISESKVKKVNVDWDKLEMDLETITPHSELTADYKFKGQLLTFPVDSAGKCKIVFDDVKGIINMKMERFQKNGKNYLRVTSWKIKNIPKSIHYDLKDIVPGNEQLSDTILKTMNDNSLQIFEELGSAFDEAYGEVHRSLANKVFEKIPEDEIFLP